MSNNSIYTHELRVKGIDYKCEIYYCLYPLPKDNYFSVRINNEEIRVFYSLPTSIDFLENYIDRHIRKMKYKEYV